MSTKLSWIVGGRSGLMTALEIGKIAFILVVLERIYSKLIKGEDDSALSENNQRRL